MSAPLRDGTEITPQERRKFFSPDELREQAVGQGRLADYAMTSGRPDRAIQHIRRAKELTLAALALEQSKVLV